MKQKKKQKNHGEDKMRKPWPAKRPRIRRGAEMKEKETEEMPMIERKKKKKSKKKKKGKK